MVCDLHPKFTTTALAKEMAEADGSPLIQVQHHHAHAAALMAEHNLEEAVTLSATATATEQTARLGAAKSYFAPVSRRSLSVLGIWNRSPCLAEMWLAVILCVSPLECSLKQA